MVMIAKQHTPVAHQFQMAKVLPQGLTHQQSASMLEQLKVVPPYQWQEASPLATWTVLVKVGGRLLVLQLILHHHHHHHQRVIIRLCLSNLMKLKTAPSLEVKISGIQVRLKMLLLVTASVILQTHKELGKVTKVLRAQSNLENSGQPTEMFTMDCSRTGLSTGKERFSSIELD